MKTDWMKARQTKYTLYVTVYLLVIVAVLGAANWLANQHNKSIDSTSNKQFSLSDQTIKVVKGLKQDVTITDYDKTSSFGTHATCSTVTAISRRNCTWCISIRTRSRKWPRPRASAPTASIMVDSGTKKEEAKSLTEEEVTGALIRSLKSGERNVCFVSGSGEHGLDDSGRTGYSNAKEALEKSNYKTKTISLLKGGPEASKCRLTARFWWWPVPSMSTSSRRSMPSRPMWPMAAARC